MERVVDDHAFYDCHDLLLEHKAALFDYLVGHWRDLFNVSFDVLLYDLTSTYFEIDPPLSDTDKRQFGYSRDKRSDCVQVLIALIVTPQGFPLAYEVLAGNTADNTTLKDFLVRIEKQYGKARRCWCLDRGVPTEEVLAQMRSSDPPVQYVEGTPKGRLTPSSAPCWRSPGPRRGPTCASNCSRRIRNFMCSPKAAIVLPRSGACAGDN
jgi:hypothetical protein